MCIINDNIVSSATATHCQVVNNRYYIYSIEKKIIQYREENYTLKEIDTVWPMTDKIHRYLLTEDGKQAMSCLNNNSIVIQSIICNNKICIPKNSNDDSKRDT